MHWVIIVLLWLQGLLGPGYLSDEARNYIRPYCEVREDGPIWDCGNGLQLPAYDDVEVRE